MKTKEANQTTLSGKKLILFVACVATISILNSLDIQARDYKDHLTAKYGYEAIVVAEPTSFFPGTSNWAIDFQFAILDAMIKNRLQRNHLAVSQRDKVIQKAQSKSAESAGGYAAGNSER